jgi:hypothetical protein
LIKNELNSVFIALHSTTPAKAVSWLDATVMLRWSNCKQQQHQQAQVTERSGSTVFPENAHGSTEKV